MSDFVERDLENDINQPTIMDGAVSDFDLLPKDLEMPPRPESEQKDNIYIELGPLEFDYSQAREEVARGESRLRLVKDESGCVLGFTIVSPGESSSIIKMLWINPHHRRIALGEKLLQDAIQILPQGIISMDIWGGEPMTKLAQKLGFIQNPGDNMTNRYSYQKQT